MDLSSSFIFTFISEVRRNSPITAHIFEDTPLAQKISLLLLRTLHHLYPKNRSFTMHITFLTILTLLGSAISAPAPFMDHHRLAARDGRLIQQAWKDIGDQYTRMDVAYQVLTITTPTVGAITQSDIPVVHQDIVNLLRSTANALGRTQPISMLEAVALIVPAQALSSKITASLSRIITMKRGINAAGGILQVEAMIKEERDAYIAWSNTLNTLLPVAQKGIGQMFANQIIAAYTNAATQFHIN
jgi:hypothetical protein